MKISKFLSVALVSVSLLSAGSLADVPAQNTAQAANKKTIEKNVLNNIKGTWYYHKKTMDIKISFDTKGNFSAVRTGNGSGKETGKLSNVKITKSGVRFDFEGIIKGDVDANNYIYIQTGSIKVKNKNYKAISISYSEYARGQKTPATVYVRKNIELPKGF